MNARTRARRRERRRLINLREYRGRGVPHPEWHLSGYLATHYCRMTDVGHTKGPTVLWDPAKAREAARNFAESINRDIHEILNGTGEPSPFDNVVHDVLGGA